MTDKVEKISRAKAVVIARKGLPMSRIRAPSKKAAAAAAATVKKAPFSERRKEIRAQRKSLLCQSRNHIRVMKQLGGTIKFAKKLRSIRKVKDLKIKSENRTVLHKQKKEKKKAAIAAVKGKKDRNGQKLKPVFKKEHKYDVKKMRTFYATQLAPRKLPSRNFFLGTRTYNRRRTPYLRRSLLAGTVCIVLAGRFKCKRVVFLKQLKKSGLCLITGPMGLNAVPMRRISQNILIATSVRVDISKSKLPKGLKDSYFKRVKTPKKKKTTEEDIFETKKKTKKGPSDERKNNQKTVDRMIVHAIKQRKDKKILLKYLSTDFGLLGNRYVHKMKF